jgi:FkbM family methyltransferase
MAQLLTRPLPPLAAGRVAELLYHPNLGAREPHRFSVQVPTGSRFRGSTGDWAAVPLAVCGYSGEWRNWGVALAVCGAGDTIIEIGASLGTDTVAYSDIVGATGRVIAIEPLRYNLANLERVVAQLRHPNVTVLPYAVDDRPGDVRIWSPPAGKNTGMARLLQDHEDGTVEQVRAVTLDALEAELGAAALIVADVEGAEVRVLRGGHRYLAAHRPTIVVEANRDHLADAGEGLMVLHDALASAGYLSFRMRRFDFEPVAAGAQLPPHSNWVSVHETRAGDLDRIRRVLRRVALRPPVPGINPLFGPRRNGARRAHE